MASKKRKINRANKQPADKIVPLHKRKVKRDMQNAGGFYEGMPGVKLDSLGNRKMIDFIVTPDGDKNAYLYANPFIIKAAIRDALIEHKELRDLTMSAFVDYLFSNRLNPAHLFLRVAYRLKTWRMNYKYQRAKRKAFEALEQSKP